MKQFLLLTSIFFIATGLGFSQAPTSSCGSDQVMQRMMDADSNYVRNIFILNKRARALDRLPANERSNEIHTIPIVFHIIHEGEAVGQGSNLSDEQVLSALTALNEDFRKIQGSNGDGDGADVGIEFCLAKRTPEGDATNGIVRVDGSVVPNYAEEGIRASGDQGAPELEVKALSTWPREDYLNIWVVNEIENNDALNGIQGYAYFPINNPVDGVVMLHNAVGTIGNIKPNTALNRTLSHEVGHYLGLYHTFHNTNDCAAEVNCESQGDRVCDTPVTTLAVSCANPACGGTQQTENYMDYTAESCRNMFTEGQKTRMRSTLENERTSILSSAGCVPVTDYDLAITEITSPTQSSCYNEITPRVRMTNYGIENISAASITYGIDGTYDFSFSWSGNLTSGSSILIDLPSITSPVGTHFFNARTNNPSGQPDQNESNDALSGEYTIANGATFDLAVSLDYFGTENTWSIVDENGTEVANGGPYINNNQGLVMNESVCLNTGCYTLWFFDVYGDGMSFTNGSYTFTDADNNIIASNSGNFGDEASHPFCVEFENPAVALLADFSASQTTICAGASVNFQNASLNEPSTWTWSFPGGSPSSSSQVNPQNITYATAGTYQVSLTVSNDAGTDTETKTAFITVGSAPNISVNALNPSCAGLNNGSISLSGVPSGSTVSWNTGASGNNLSGLAAGTYTANINTSNGCTASVNAGLSSPTALNANLSANAPSCFGENDGSIQANVSGGTSPYSFNWSNGGSNNQITNLIAGNYSCNISDANGCSTTLNQVLSEPNELEANLSVLNISCDGSLGSASIAPIGGTPPYTVFWSTNQSSMGIDQLQAGSYTVSIFDANACNTSESFTIVDGNELNIIPSITGVSCSGNNDGAISIDIYGGNGNYSISWSNGGNSTSINNLSAGTYNVNVIDGNGCMGEASFVVAQSNPINMSIFKSDISCNGLSDGEAQASISGGTPPYDLTWSNGSTNSSISNLSAGSYNLQVTDANGCESNESITIVEPSVLNASISLLSNETCVGNDGSLAVNILGGTPAYTITWNTGANGTTLLNLSANTYSATIVDGGGCSTNASGTVNYDCVNELQSSMLIDEDCGAMDLQLSEYITCEAVEGAEMYQWKVENLAAGLYSESYTMGNNPNLLLSEIDDFEYGMNAQVSIRVQKQGNWSAYGEACTIATSQDVPMSLLFKSDCGAILELQDQLNCTPVAGAYAYEWEISSAEESAIYQSYVNLLNLDPSMGFLPGGEYDVRVRVQVGNLFSEWSSACTISFENTSDLENLGDNTSGFRLYPNPSNGEEISFEMWNLSGSLDVIVFKVFDTGGKLIENIQLSPMGAPKFTTTYRFGRRLAAGMYFVQYQLGNDLKEEKLIVR
ncbi:MAG: M43 family zinc metalloprotease [Flavobacteriales bacterium]|nr:M43 family zinc metalloprotease [Flavobacteriales bacterium]